MQKTFQFFNVTFTRNFDETVNLLPACVRYCLSYNKIIKHIMLYLPYIKLISLKIPTFLINFILLFLLFHMQVNRWFDCTICCVSSHPCANISRYTFYIQYTIFVYTWLPGCLPACLHTHAH